MSTQRQGTSDLKPIRALGEPRFIPGNIQSLKKGEIVVFGRYMHECV